MKFILAICSFLSLQAGADVISYDCTIALFAHDLLPSGQASTQVQRPVVAKGSHGGDPFEWSVGNHRIGIVADGKWRGIIWEHEGKQVAQVLTAGTQTILGNSVILLHNPEDLEEQVQLICDPITDDFPKE